MIKLHISCLSMISPDGLSSNKKSIRNIKKRLGVELFFFSFTFSLTDVSLHLNMKFRFKSIHKAGGQSPTGNVCYIFIACKFTIKYTVFSVVHLLEALHFVLQVLNETRAKKCNRHLQIRNTIFKLVIKLYISCFLFLNPMC